MSVCLSSALRSLVTLKGTVLTEAPPFYHLGLGHITFSGATKEEERLAAYSLTNKGFGPEVTHLFYLSYFHGLSFSTRIHSKTVGTLLVLFNTVSFVHSRHWTLEARITNGALVPIKIGIFSMNLIIKNEEEKKHRVTTGQGEEQAWMWKQQKSM